MGKQAVTFDTPGQVLAFIRKCLNTSDVDCLYDAVAEQAPELWRLRIFDDLGEIEKNRTLEKVFLSEESFSLSSDMFKLGGHSTETKHLHIDLVRHGDSWCLKQIWKCR